MQYEIIGFVLGVLASFIAFLVKDAVTKNTHSLTIKELEKDNENLNRVNQSQDLLIQNNREELLSLKSSMLNLRERFDDFNKMHQSEMRDIQITLKEFTQETTKSMASLESTLKGISGWLQRVDSKINK